MTLKDSIQGFRLRVLTDATRSGVTAMCARCGVSRTWFSRVRARLERYGPDGLHPQSGGRPGGAGPAWCRWWSSARSSRRRRVRDDADPATDGGAPRSVARAEQSERRAEQRRHPRQRLDPVSDRRDPARTESNLAAEVSLDQLVAWEQGQHTQLSSLELALDPRDVVGSCDVGFSCLYTSAIAWRDETTPLPMEANPWVVFERLFGDTGSTDPSIRLARIKRTAVCSTRSPGRIAELGRDVGSGDRAKLDQYLDAVRDVERRIQQAEEQNSRELPEVLQPAGVPALYGDHARLMFDLQVLAYQTDLTRVITFMLGAS